ncbi:MAG: ABC transporter ATP-binding protein [Burkholderiales bacterium]|nr:ABC transporter ATP-binding protein [Burkholderiales bacterium]
MSALAIEAVSVHFGGVTAVDAVSLDIAKGERRALLGPNGAGKTTLFNAVGGQERAAAGSIRLFGEEVTAMPPHQRAVRGLARTFQITKLFPNLALRENVLIAVQAFHAGRYSLHRTALSYADLQLRVDEVLLTWGLRDKADAMVRHLSYGDQRQLEIVMALANQPRLLLLDEPTAGLSSAETAMVTELIAALPREVTVLFIEHDMDVAFRIADRVTILNQGRIVADGKPDEIRADARIRAIYFGTTH